MIAPPSVVNVMITIFGDFVYFLRKYLAKNSHNHRSKAGFEPGSFASGCCYMGIFIHTEK
jgi:hypothetical protein